MPFQRWKRQKKRVEKKKKGTEKKIVQGRKTLKKVKELKSVVGNAPKDIQYLRNLQKQLKKRTGEFDQSHKKLSLRTGVKRRLTLAGIRANLATKRKFAVNDAIKRIDAIIDAYKQFVQRARKELGMEPAQKPSGKKQGKKQSK